MGGVLAAHQTYCERVVGLSGGGMALLANGRVRSTCSYNYVEIERCWLSVDSLRKLCLNQLDGLSVLFSSAN